MDKLTQIQHDLDGLSPTERELIVDWLQDFAAAHVAGRGVAEFRSAYATGMPPSMTLDEYMEFEEKSPYRHEYVNGEIYAMSGPSLAHGRIAQELFVAVRSHLSGGPCEAFLQNIKLKIQTDTEEIVYYPDLMVTCQPEKWSENCVRNPKLVAEVLSPSTQRIDRREKALTYQRIASVEEYVLLAQDEFRVTVHRREENWQPVMYAGAEAVAELRSIGLNLPLTQIYGGNRGG